MPEYAVEFHVDIDHTLCVEALNAEDAIEKVRKWIEDEPHARYHLMDRQFIAVDAHEISTLDKE